MRYEGRVRRLELLEQLHRVERQPRDARERGLRMRASRLLAVATLLGMACVSRVAHATVTFGLSFAIARDAGEPVADDAWVVAQIDEANRLFAPLGTRFRWTIDKELSEPHGELHTRADRDALTPLTERSSIDVFLVRELEDVDEPGRLRMGVCWTGRGGKRFIVLSRTARSSVLAHELGHFFGNPHSSEVDNLMSYSRTGAAVFLDPRQATTVKTFTARLLETGRLVDVGPPWRVF